MEVAKYVGNAKVKVYYLNGVSGQKKFRGIVRERKLSARIVMAQVNVQITDRIMNKRWEDNSDRRRKTGCIY